MTLIMPMHRAPLEPHEVGLDIMAGVSVFSYKALLKDVLRDQRGPTLMGVGRDVIHRGSLVGIENRAAWRGPSGMPNILSFLELAKIAKITWDQDKLSFSAVIGGKTYTVPGRRKGKSSYAICPPWYMKGANMLLA